MASSIDWSQCSAVESVPGKVSGAWVFRGTRVPVAAIFENLKSSSLEEVLENFHVTRDQVQTVLDFAAKSALTPVELSRVGLFQALTTGSSSAQAWFRSEQLLKA